MTIAEKIALVVVALVSIYFIIIFIEMVVNPSKEIDAQCVEKVEEVVVVAPVEEAYSISLNDDERALVERVVYAEIGNGTLEEQKSVAQVIYCRAKLWGMSVTEVLTSPNQFAKPTTKPIPELTRLAVIDVFDYGNMPFEDDVTHFYAYNKCSPDWQYNMVEIGKDRYHRFMIKEE